MLTRELQFKRLSYITSVSFLMASVVAITLAVSGAGIYALIADRLVQPLVWAIGCYIGCNVHYSLKFSYKRLKRLMPFGIFTTVAGLIDGIYENSLSFLFGKYFGVRQTGYFSQAKKIGDMSIQTTTRTVGLVAFPILSKLSNKKNEFTEEAGRIFNTFCAVLFPVLISIALYSREIVMLLFGEQWIPSAHYLAMFIFAEIFVVMDFLYRTFIKSYGQVQLLCGYTLVKRIIGIAVLLITLIFHGGWILQAFILSSILGYLFNLHLYCRLTHEGLLRHLLQAFRILFPGFMFYFIIRGCRAYMPDYTVLILTILMLCMYYFWVLPRHFNINVIKLLDGLMQKHG